MLAPRMTREDSRRRARHDARRVLWRESHLERVQRCGLRPANPDGLVGIKAAGVEGSRNAGFSGLQTCGSVWACPVCSAKIAAVRQEEIGAATARWEVLGGQVAMATFTMRHRRGHGLAELWDALGAAWGKVTSGRGWVEDQDRFGVFGWLRVVEVKKGCNGWHVHIHALFFLDRRSVGQMFTEDDDPLGSFASSMFARWRSALVRKGMPAPTRKGFDLKVTRGGAFGLGEYFTKSVYMPSEKAGLEIARGDLKEDRTCPRGDVHRAPFAILRDVVEVGLADDLDDWHEYERASQGRRQLTWSKGLRRALLPTLVEVSDTEAAEADHGGDMLVLLPRKAWSALVFRPGVPCDLLAAAEADTSGAALRALLASLGVAWLDPLRH